jgi:hypothetical protein
LYPGKEQTKFRRMGFREIIPGLGAFQIRPSEGNDTGSKEVEKFFEDVVFHFVNRTSQREKTAFRIFDIHKSSPNTENEVREALPEAFGANRSLLPDETFVLVGFYDSYEQYDWLKKNKLYNFRMGTGRGSLILDKETVSSKYLLLHTSGENVSGDLWKITSKGPRVFSKDDLLKIGYPSPSQDNYLVIQLEEVTDPEFENVCWDFKKLKNYSSGRASAFPFTTCLAELMKNKII